MTIARANNSILKVISSGGGGGVIPGTTVIGGKTYKTITINDQTWLAENLDLIIPGISVNPGGVPYSPAIFYPREDYRTTYGVLYNYYAVEYLETNKSTLIPGWHVPTKSEFDDLFTYLNGIVCSSKLLNDRSFGCGFPYLGFNILPGGNYDIYFGGGSFQYEGSTAYLHCLTLDSSNRQYHITAQASNLTFDTQYGNREYGLSLRLIKDS